MNSIFAALSRRYFQVTLSAIHHSSCKQSKRNFEFVHRTFDFVLFDKGRDEKRKFGGLMPAGVTT